MDVRQQPIDGFTFYSLNECTHQQLLSHTKFPVNIYHRKLTNQIFVVKELPLQPHLVQIYRLLKDSQTLNIVPICGLTKLTYLSKQKQDKKNTKKQTEKTLYPAPNFSQYHSTSKNAYMLLWMQKHEKSLTDYVEERRKQVNPFSVQQIKNFLFQMLTTLRILQKKGISHRDIKPQNILYHHNRYFLCDFDEAIITKYNNKQKSPQQIMNDLQYTTILYSTPKFLRSIKENKFHQKYFDPYKMDVYSFGLTLLYVCSLGKFNIDDRHLYLYNENGIHEQFIDQERRRYVKKDPQLKVFNSIIKLMLEEDQYKRDDFQTLNEKVIDLLGVDNQSEQSFSTKSRTLLREKRQKIRKSHGKGFTWGKLKPSQKFILFAFTLSVLIYFSLLIF